MKAYQEINRQPSRAEQIKAGVTIFVGFGIFAALQYFLRHRTTVAEVLCAIGALGLAASLVPGLGRLLYVGWMSLGVTIGIFTQPIVVTVAYVALFVPLGFVFRLMGRDLMKRRLASPASSYWEDCKEAADPTTYFRQY
jgi:hypothetical protein